MYGIAEDKSQWNIGNWTYLGCNRYSFVPGVISGDAEVVARFPDKFVYKAPLSGWPYMQRVCGEVLNPSIIWDVIHYDQSTNAYGLYDLTEDEQEDAAIIEDVYFANEYVYIVAKEMPIKKVFIRFKGA